jgi:hypothetical protein
MLLLLFPKSHVHLFTVPSAPVLLSLNFTACVSQMLALSDVKSATGCGCIIDKGMVTESLHWLPLVQVSVIL